MAKRTTLLTAKGKAKKPKVTRGESYFMNLKYMGQEPVFTKPLSETEYGRAFNWYNTMCTNAEAREYLHAFLVESDRLKDSRLLKSVPDVWLPLTCAWIARMLSRGNELPESAYTFFEAKLEESFGRIEIEKAEKKAEVNKPTIQERMKEKASDLIGEIEHEIDTNENFSLYEYLKTKVIPASYAQTIADYYTPWLGELLEAAEGTDKDLKEAYKGYNKKQLNARVLFINNIIEDAEKYGAVTKKVRAPRKPRPVSIEKKLKSFKYQKEDPEFKVASVNPSKIIGAQEIWTFNTKYKTVTVLRALPKESLDVKGMSILNYDEKASVTKKTGRSTQDFVKRVLSSGKVALRTLTDELKTGAPLAYRSNENTIILKVV